MNPKKVEGILIFVLLGFVLISLFVLIYTFVKYGGECVTNPRNYYFNELKEQTGLDVMCRCTFLGGKYRDFTISTYEYKIDLRNLSNITVLNITN